MTKITLEIPDELMSRLDITQEFIQDIFSPSIRKLSTKRKTKHHSNQNLEFMAVHICMMICSGGNGFVHVFYRCMVNCPLGQGITILN